MDIILVREPNDNRSFSLSLPLSLSLSIYIYILWQDGWKPEQCKKKRRPLLRLYTEDPAAAEPIFNIVNSRYLATTTEQIEDFTCAVVAVIQIM
jgi:hypothetical protein